jgi:hypothetical protein
VWIKTQKRRDLNVPKPRRQKIEYFDEDDNQDVPTIEAEAIEVESVEINEPDETEYLVGSEEQEDDLDNYVYHERVGVLELINYLPRVPKAVLNGDRDFTPQEWVIAQEDFSRGFRPIDPRYIIKYQVPDDASRFRTKEDLSRDTTKVSPGMVSKWVKATTDEPRKFPLGLLQDNFGFTQYAVAIYRNLMRYTCTHRFLATKIVVTDSGEELLVINWDSINRDTVPPPIKNPELSEKNPDYALSSTYWQKLSEQYQDWCDRMEWLTEYKKAQSLRAQEPEVIEFATETDRELHQQMSQFATKVELSKQAALLYLGDELEDLNRQAVKLARKAAAKGKADALEAYADSFKQGEPEPLEEEQDLWRGEDQV